MSFKFHSEFRRRQWLTLTLITMIALFGACRLSYGQADAGREVQINLPAEVEIKALVDYVSERLSIRILYDDKLATRKINVRAPEPISADSLLAVLQSALRMNGMMIAKADAEGWYQIVETSDMPQVADPLQAFENLEARPSATAATQIFPLKHLSPEKLSELVQPFLSSTGANTVVLEEQSLLIVTDFVSNLSRIAGLIEQIDVAGSATRVEFIPVKHLPAQQVATRLQELLEARAKASQVRQQGPSGPSVAVTADVRTNQLIVVGSEVDILDLKEIIRELDVSLDLLTEVYTPRFLAASRVDRLIQRLIPPQDAGRLYQSSADAEENVLVVTTTAELHEQIQGILDRLDVAGTAQSRGRIRFYRLKHVTAPEALETLRSIQDGSVPQSREFVAPTDGRFRLLEGAELPQPNRPQLQPQRELPLPGVFEEALPETAINIDVNATQQNNPLDSGLLPTGLVQITADIPSNSLIIVADPATQQLYAELIKQLDRPRPQVLIEAKIVALDTTDDFGLGVEVSAGDRTTGKRLFAFTSFGLSDVDPVSGALSIIPGLGFNGTLVDPEVADVVLRGFTSHRKAKVISSPRVLVDDNATGLLTSVTEIPFTSVNASDTVATTSFAGFAEAGTTITVTPHISDDDRLQLEYRITLNAFQGSPTSAGVPPPRQTDEVESVVTIPDGHTLIVGGLHQTIYSHNTDSFPFIEHIPILRDVASSFTENAQESSMFIFLKPVILRDDRFRDLKYFSRRDVRRADVPGDFPTSEPTLME